MVRYYTFDAYDKDHFWVGNLADRVRFESDDPLDLLKAVTAYGHHFRQYGPVEFVVWRPADGEMERVGPPVVKVSDGE